MEETGRVRASACSALQWRHVRRRGRAGPSRAWHQGAWEVSARAPAGSSAAGESRGAGPRERGRGRGRAGPNALGTRRQLAVADGKSWQDGVELRRRYPSHGHKRRTRLRRPFQRVLSRRGAAGDVPAQAGRSLCDRAGDARTPLTRTLRRLGPPSWNRPTSGGLGPCCFSLA